MPSYRVRPSAIPKHLKIPQKPPAAQRLLDGRPPIRDTTKASPNGNAAVVNSQPPSPAWFRLPSFRTTGIKDAAKAHPYVRLRDPRSLRLYDLLTKLSVPTLIIYFLLVSPAGEQSEVSIIRRWTEGLSTDMKNWWNSVPQDQEVDPEVLLALDREKTP
ncbi:hypothetical protein FS842_003352 [Serendipita sp. 407]|nr:hypothetical protein FS842_003352 [Serendipita sp. 407]